MALILADYLYQCTAKSKVSGRKTLLALAPSKEDKDVMAALLDALGTEEASPQLQDIAWVKGKKDTYYYHGGIMPRQYAELSALLEDKDILATISSVARSDSQLYPRPTQFSKLRTIPFFFTQDEILGAAARMKDEEQYKDIGVVTASNGNSAFYSSQYISERYARSLLEMIEVDEYLYP